MDRPVIGRSGGPVREQRARHEIRALTIGDARQKGFSIGGGRPRSLVGFGPVPRFCAARPETARTARDAPDRVSAIVACARERTGSMHTLTVSHSGLARLNTAAPGGGGWKRACPGSRRPSHFARSQARWISTGIRRPSRHRCCCVRSAGCLAGGAIAPRGRLERDFAASSVSGQTVNSDVTVRGGASPPT